MHAPQIIYVVLLTIALTYEMVMHGKPRSDPHNFPARLIGATLMVSLLYWGGFFGGGTA